MSYVAETATLVHGYTMADVDRLAGKSAHSARSYLGDFASRVDEAWHAIVEELYTSSSPPTRYQLLVAGMQAVDRAASEYRKHNGLNLNTYDLRPSFGRFWIAVVGHEDDFTDRLCERLALPQVLATLSPRQYQVIAALAAHDSAADAAEALGMTRANFYFHLGKARKRAIEAWYSPEIFTAANWRASTPESCRNGHARDEHGFKTKDEQWGCRLCQRAGKRRFHARERT